MLLFTGDVAERSEAVGQQRTSEEGDDRVNGVGAAAAANHHAARAADVPGRGGRAERETETRERAHGPKEEQAA